MNIKRNDMDIIDTENAIVCFMDILGYSNLVCNERNKKKIYRILKNCLQNLQGNQDLLKQVRYSIKKQLLGDALLFVLDIKKVPKQIGDLPQMCNVKQVFISFFLRSICRAFLEIIAETKYFLRGGIALGQYYQSYFDDDDKGNKFIFSKALAEAHELEKKAVTPRIVLSNHLYSYIARKRRNTSLQNIDIFKSIDGLYYLSPYFILPNGNENVKDTKEIVGKVVKAVEFQIKIAKKKNKSVFEKYRWFADYHNRAIVRKGINGKFRISVPT